MQISIGNKSFYKILLLAIYLLVGGNTAWGGIETQNGKQYNVVYLKSGASGNGDSSGSPVGSWTNAYKKLINTGDRDYDWEHNIIVIVDNMQINFKEGDTKDKSNNQGTPATITGVWPWDANDKATTTQIKSGGQAKISGEKNSIGAEVRFRNLRIQGDNGLQDRMSLRLHSTCFDEGLVMMGFNELGKSYGMIAGRKAPALHIQLSFDHFGNGYTRPASDIYKMPNEKEMTVTFKSGRYGRVAVSRSQGTSDACVRANYIQGTPKNPIMAHVIVDIPKGNDNEGGYADDISILLGGSSQGLVCADLGFEIKHGTIGTLVAGTQGNDIKQCTTSIIPAATFAGRTKVNVGNKGGANDDVTIQTYFGGTQGRAQVENTTAYSFFYGESEFNMYSGTVMDGVFASATAFSGVGDATNHTPDYAIPYVDNKTDNNLNFSGYKENGIMATVKSNYQKDIDLSQTKITFNIYGGDIKGGLYGGSKGYEPQIAVAYAPDRAGTHFGDTFVNVYGGTIEGGVYGGGLGTEEYYNQNPKDGFNTVAQVYGNTNVKIYGGDIQGNIYGGGSGIKSNNTKSYEYLNIAKVVGTTNVTIDPRMPDDFETHNPDWTYNGNIYGGGSYGAVEGSTNVNILGGIILGDVYGAGMGETGHPNKAKVTGTTKVIVGE